jgi:putative nucleotidyltransferase with HDIG domain
MKKKQIGITRFKDRIKRILVYLLTFLVTYFILVTAIAPKRYDVNEGDIASNDIKAPRETIDEKASEQKLNEALVKIGKQYTEKNEVKSQAVQNIGNLFDKLENLNSIAGDVNSEISQLKQITNLSDAQYKILLNIKSEQISGLKEEMLKIIDLVYVNKILEGDEESLKQAKEIANTEIDKININIEILSTLKTVVSNEIKPNLFYDSVKKQELIDEVKKNTEKVIIKKNQIIVNEGEPVTASQIEILKSLGLLNEDSSKGNTVIYLVLAVFLSLIIFISNWYIYRHYKNIFFDNKKMILINLISLISIMLARVLTMISPYLIPLACAPILMTILVNYKISLFINTMNIVIISIMVGFDPQMMVLSIISTLLGATIIKKMQQRNDILYATIFIAAISGIMNFSIGVILSSNTKEIVFNSLYSVVGVLIAGILAVGFLPFFESMFDIVTTLKLLELSNPNSPLLKKLLMEAPGTYHHSMLVANLAEMAAEEVGANSVVTRIGAYYHDVGKIARPYFFKENQITKENPHDKITGNLSTLIILSHVKDGLELAKEHNLPKIIQDIIVQHHGTTLVKYFYYTIKNNAENPDEIKEEDYRYQGPIPNTKEAGIIMLADSTEAAVRSITDHTKERIEKMVYEIIEDKLHTGQLDDCDLTLKDLSKIRNCFLKGLNGIYHKRIEYPTEKK